MKDVFCEAFAGSIDFQLGPCVLLFYIFTTLFILAGVMLSAMYGTAVVNNKEYLTVAMGSVGISLLFLTVGYFWNNPRRFDCN